MVRMYRFTGEGYYAQQAGLRAFLLSPQFIHVYAVQIANYIYWLRYFGIVDWTVDLRPAFEAAYPDSQDEMLDTLAFNNKLYGLTHIVLANSNLSENRCCPATPVDSGLLQAKAVVEHYVGNIGEHV